MNYKTRKELKDFARLTLRGKYGAAIFVSMTYMLLGTGINYLCNFLIYNIENAFIYDILSYTTSYLTTIFLGMLQVGIALFYLNMAVGRRFQTADMFYALSHMKKKVFCISFLLTTLYAICIYPYQILITLYFDKDSYTYLFAGLGAALIGGLVYLYVSLCFSQVRYLFFDFPQDTVLTLFSKSLRLMKKNKWRLLKLRLSFIPVMLLGICSCGLGFLWVTPYRKLTETAFFLDLMQTKEA